MKVLLLGCIIGYVYLCYKNIVPNFWKYLRKTMLVPVVIIFAISLLRFMSSGHYFEDFFIVNLISMVVFFSISSLFYLLFKDIRKKDLEKEEAKIKSQKEEEKRKKETAALETDDMRKIKSLMGEIMQKKEQLNAFNAEIGKKISSLETMADTAIAEAYGEVAVGYKRGRYLDSYDEIRSRYSDNVDNEISLRCDHIVQKINHSINGSRKVLQSNGDDKLKYDELYTALQNQYNKEYKIERMKVIGNKVNELTDSTAEIEASLNSEFVLEKSMEEFNRLNLEIENRRDLELKYTADNI
ncbi:MAG: hypothetical protein K6F33_09970 [Bacteroidales bacterium]|nr:hypothetical protein [Bacteroidales bacterium]